LKRLRLAAGRFIPLFFFFVCPEALAGLKRTALPGGMFALDRCGIGPSQSCAVHTEDADAAEFDALPLAETSFTIRRQSQRLLSLSAADVRVARQHLRYRA